MGLAAKQYTSLGITQQAAKEANRRVVEFIGELFEES